MIEKMSTKYAVATVAMLMAFGVAAPVTAQEAQTPQPLDLEPLYGLTPDSPIEIDRQAPTGRALNLAVAETQPKTAAEAIRVGKLDSDLLESLQAGPGVQALVTPADGRGLDELDLPMRRFENFPFAVVELSDAADVDTLVASPAVAHIGADIMSELFVAQSLKVIHQPEAAAAGKTGAGSYVAILDTGVRFGKPAFGDCRNGPGSPNCRIAGMYEIAPRDFQRDDHGHGTNVAAITAGVAPDARILMYDVFGWSEGEFVATTIDLLVAMDHVLSQKAAGLNVVALNMSLGSLGFVGECDWVSPAMAIAMETLVDADILPVVASGNNFHAFDGLAWPACNAYAFSVGATYDSSVGGVNYGVCQDSFTRVDRVTCFSQVDPTLDIWAPGAIIRAGGEAMAGTSQAAPHAAGAVALLASARGGGAIDWWIDLLTKGELVQDHRTGLVRNRLDLHTLLSLDDVDPPTVDLAPMRITNGRLRPDGTLPVRIRWTATDPNGVRTHELAVRINGSPWQLVASGPHVNDGVWLLPKGPRYEFAVRAVDTPGNISQWQLWDPFTPKVLGESSPRITLAGLWDVHRSNGSQGGRVATTSEDGASISTTFTGNKVAVVGHKYAGAGSLAIYVDGVLRKVVDMSKGQLGPGRIIFSYNLQRNKRHEVRVVAIVQPDRPTVSFDAIVFVRE